MRTGQDVREPGLYSSECCSREIRFAKNDMFSRCPRCLRLCEWDLIETVAGREQRIELKGRPEAA
jgi:hypothetical protein